MRNIDNLAKQYFRDPRRFADIVNYMVYDGMQIVKAEDLQEKDPAEIGIIPESGEGLISKQKFRDLLKVWTVKQFHNSVIAIIGLENQTNVHYAMPVKSGLYDALNYAHQVEMLAALHRQEKDLRGAEFLSGMSKEDRLTPVITIVVYLGEKRWDGPRTLHEMLKMEDPRILPFVPDYRINLLDPSDISDFGKFATEVRLLMQAINASGDDESLSALIEKHGDEYDGFDRETGMMIQQLTDIPVAFDSKYGKDKEARMCTAIKQLVEKSFAEGRAEGRVEGHEEGKNLGYKSALEVLIQSLVAEGLTQDAAEKRAKKLLNFD